MSSDELMHYGTKRHSGRYPWGSGEDPYQHEGWNLRKRDKYLKEQGMTSQADRARALGFETTSAFRAAISAESNAERAERRAEVKRLSEQGLGATEIARRMGLKNESTVRSLLNEETNARKAVAYNTIEALKAGVEKYRYVDVGNGVASSLNVTESRLKTAVNILKNEGYEVHEIYIPQVGVPGQYTTAKILCAPGVSHEELKLHQSEIGILGHVDSADPGKLGLDKVKSISSKRVMINYAEDGGTAKDGVIELRRGVKGLDLGNARYAQVRIGVDGTHYIKGMAVYADDLPPGVDIRFNTNKHEGTPMKKVLKEMKTIDSGEKAGQVDWDNPFGSSIKGGREGQRGYLNIVREEGDWKTWSKTLSSQMLSKQSKALAERQLKLARENSEAELDEIMHLTNPVIKEHLLQSYADGCDSAAVHLKAAALPRQCTHVILPIPSIKPTEIYAPQYENGTKVVLIRHPHGGTFEIPELTVNNRNREARSILGGAKGTKVAIDAVGIHASVAERLSGADFDGDTVIVIPNTWKGKRLVKTTPPLQGLKDFDPKAEYPEYPGMKVISHSYQQRQMGIVSNLITDMTIRGATESDLAAAVRHSMVIIDAEKHHLNWKQSEKDNRIQELTDKYQLKVDGKHGASTIISRAKSEARVPERRQYYDIDPATGRKIFKPTGKSYVNKDGETVYRQTKSTQMYETEDARTLISKFNAPIEQVYASYANSMKALGNQARKASMAVPEHKYSKEAYSMYKKEVESLNAKLELARANQPLERRAQIIANQIAWAKERENPHMDKDSKKKMRNQALAAARIRVGKNESNFKITDREWDAIQAGAVSKTKLKSILNYADQDYLKKLAMPKTAKGMTTAKIGRAKAMLNAGYTWAEIAQALGVSVSTLQRAVE